MARTPRKTPRKSPRRQPAKTAPQTSAAAKRPARKQDQLLALLQAPDGASIAQIGAELGWLPHSCRAALSGLRRQGRTLEKLAAPDQAVRYRLADATARTDAS